VHPDTKPHELWIQSVRLWGHSRKPLSVQLSSAGLGYIAKMHHRNHRENPLQLISPPPFFHRSSLLSPWKEQGQRRRKESVLSGRPCSEAVWQKAPYDHIHPGHFHRLEQHSLKYTPCRDCPITSKLKLQFITLELQENIVPKFFGEGKHRWVALG